MTTKPVGSSSKKGASRANLKPPSTKPRRKTPPPKADNSHHRHKKKRSGPGITSAIAKRSAKRYGSPEARLKLRLTMEETLGPTTPLRPDDNLIRLSEAAKRIGIATWTLRKWALDGKIQYRRIGNVLLMIPESEIEKLREQRGN